MGLGQVGRGRWLSTQELAGTAEVPVWTCCHLLRVIAMGFAREPRSCLPRHALLYVTLLLATASAPVCSRKHKQHSPPPPSLIVYRSPPPPPSPPGEWRTPQSSCSGGNYLSTVPTSLEEAWILAQKELSRVCLWTMLSNPVWCMAQSGLPGDKMEPLTDGVTS